MVIISWLNLLLIPLTFKIFDSAMALLAVIGLFAALISTVAAQEFTNPVLWQDLADTDLIRVNETYYYSASNMHFSPAAPLLRSYDLVNWEYFAHSIPSLEFDHPQFNLTDGNAYNGGTYASSLRYHEAHGLFYWVGCIQGVGKSYIFSAPDPAGPWTQASEISESCYYDCGMLIDDDGTIYVSYGAWVANGADTKIWVAKLTEDLQQEEVQLVFESNEEIQYIEGSRFYKINGTYYLWMTWPGVGGHGQMIIKSSGGPFGPYNEWRQVLANSGNPVPGCDNPYQGAIVDTPEGDWWYIAFVDNWPGGRIPVLAPITWDSEGWPHVEFVGDNQWGSSYPYPLPEHPVQLVTGTDNFTKDTLGPQYEWNHNPDDSKWSVGQGLTLQTATVTDDFFSARNTLSHRILGPTSTLTIHLDHSAMVNGDKAGLAVFRYDAAWVAVSKTETETRLEMVDDVLMESSNGWVTVNKGNVIEGVPISGDDIWLRVGCDISSRSATATFSYSTDGSSFTAIGQTHAMPDGAIFFVGDRYGVFNFATTELGGEVVVKSFTISTEV
ncbi:glycosyl hydrolase [Aspergillus lucknowensis]|uniref:Glycosyl hydrolase n=1 Tax=Aspergillus lucknowensis TaxID=176173 RepID=A0ABR4LYS2_9EURO